MAVTRPDASTRVKAAVRRIIPPLQDATSATDRGRHVPEHIIAALRATGVYRMLVPAELGGDQVDLQTFLDVVELVSEGNAAAGWDLATSAWNGLLSLKLPVDGAEHIYANGPDVIFAGGLAGGGTAVATQGGYRVSGRWRFGSGCTEATWMMAGRCQVVDDDRARMDDTGRPEMRLAFIPKAEAAIHETWEVAGLRGTESHDWSLTDVYVPESLTQVLTAPPVWQGTLFRLSPWGVVNAVQLSPVATGIARRAIDALVALAKAKTPNLSQTLLRERVQVQEAVARAEVLLESSRAYRASIVADVWATAEAGEAISLAQRARLRLAGTSATENAVRAVDMMFGAGGTTAIEDGNPLSHCFRDVHVVAQNINMLPTFYEHAGRVLLGLDSGTPMIG